MRFKPTSGSFQLLVLGLSVFAGTFKSQADDTRDLTPADIADRIEATMAKFSAVEYEAEFTTVRDTNVFREGQEPLLVKGTGSYLFRTDGKRWFADEHGFSTAVGKPDVNPKRTIAGFDGERHFHVDNRSATFGEYNMGDLRLKPAAVFWRGSRTTDWLMAALRWDEAKVARKETMDGHECLVVVSQRAQKRGEPVAEGDVPYWRYEITISPNQSFLPLRTRVELEGKLYSTESIDEVAQTETGLWYPVKLTSEQHLEPIPHKSKFVHVKSLRVRDDFADENFKYEVPFGRVIVDWKKGYAWHNDPWWDELAPWMRENLDWPRRDFRALMDLRTYARPEINGKPAPEIAARKWLNGEPQSWKREGRKVTLLYFFGGGPINPTPKQIASINALAEHYRDSGLDVVGVVPERSGPVSIEQTLVELGIEFPVAIDSKGEGYYGATFDAFKLPTYTSTFVIDSEGIVHSLPSDQPRPNEMAPVEELIREKLAAIDAKLPDESQKVSHRLERGDDQAIEKEWKRRVRAKRGEARIHGSVMLTPGQPVAGGVTVEVKPVLRVLFSNTPGGWTLLQDRKRIVKVPADPRGQYSLGGLRRGTYVLTFSAPGLASIEREITVAHDDSEVRVDVRFSQGHEITGVVVDSAGKPVVAATVKATRRHFDPTKPDQYTTAHLPREPRKTDDQGVFRFNHLFDGSYTFEVTADGFEKGTTKPVAAGVETRVVLKRVEEDRAEGEATTALSDAVKVINDEASKHPVSRKLPPLTEQHVINRLKLLEKTDDLSNEEFTALKRIIETRRLPENVVLRPFLRYDTYTEMQHGWWVKLSVERKERGPFGMWVRRTPVLTRPYTQVERQHRERRRNGGGLTTLGRLVTWFDKDPQVGEEPSMSVDYEKLVARARKAITNSDTEAFLKLFHFKGAGKDVREFVKREVATIMSGELNDITVEPKRFAGDLSQWRAFTRYGPNLPVEAYVNFTFSKQTKSEDDKPKPMAFRLEAGPLAEQPKFVCHIVQEDHTQKWLGKKIGNITVSGFIYATPDGWLEFGSLITAPDHFPSLQQANLELLRMPLK